jgi:hypothetical protein
MTTPPTSVTVTPAPKPPNGNGNGPYKMVTHIFAGIATAMAAFAVTPAGMALIKQYPALAAVFALMTAAAVYHQPTHD